jgi:hypothetical protein
MKTKLFFLGLFFSSFFLKAQVSLPYYSGFDNSAQQSGWVEFKKGSTQFSHWGFNSFSAYSAPTCISHDYSPSTGITITDNWYVSPGFVIPKGGMLDSIRYMFNGFSVPDNTDTIAIYLLTGSQNPSLASMITLLFDFRGNDYQNDYTFHKIDTISLTGSTQSQYIAIRYRNTDCSSKWLSVNFDNVAISGMGNSSVDQYTKNQEVAIFPNPSHGFFKLDTEQLIEGVKIFNLLGQELTSSDYFFNNLNNSIEFKTEHNGVYLIQYQINGFKNTQKIILQ